MNVKLVAYYRVNTDKQGRSGLGLEAQKTAVTAYAASIAAELVREYTEVESGKRADRPELAKALAHAKRTGARLVIAKLDRLARNVAFLSGLMEAGTPFVACDQPFAMPLTIHILAAVAENEAIMTSERTKAALAAYKARGGKLGASRPECRNLTDAARAKGARLGGIATCAAAISAVSDLIPDIRTMRAEGLSLQAVADRLDAEGHTTRSGTAWRASRLKENLVRNVTFEPPLLAKRVDFSRPFPVNLLRSVVTACAERGTVVAGLSRRAYDDPGEMRLRTVTRGSRRNGWEDGSLPFVWHPDRHSDTPSDLGRGRRISRSRRCG